MVSVIIPAYNAEGYIIKCIRSLQAQTFSDIEIIIIDDGSVDSTGEICLNEVVLDKRIVYIRTDNHGQGYARNLGIKVALGDYITFVDSDDFVHKKYVEIMYNNLINNNADVSICNKYAVELHNDKIIRKIHIRQWINADMPLDVNDDPDLIWKVKYSLWAKMFKKKIFIENEIWQPDHKFENNTVIPTIIAHAKKIYMSSDYLYYYWINRSGSTVNSLSSYNSMILCLRAVTERFKRDNLFEKYRSALVNFCIDNIRHTMVMCLPALKNGMSDKYYALRDELVKFMCEEYNITINTNKKTVVWGSYILKKMVDNAVIFSETICEHYCFSNIESVLSAPCFKTERLVHKNKYRESMIVKDINKTFNTLHYDVDYIIIDFLEERFGCIEYGETKITFSDAIAEMAEFENANPTQAFDVEYQDMCCRFIETIKSCYPATKIVLVKNYLSESYGSLDCRKSYKNIAQIKRINSYLKKIYDVFISGCPEAIVIDNDKYLFTDEYFVHGCRPEHTNDRNFIYMGDKIGKELKLII